MMSVSRNKKMARRGLATALVAGGLALAGPISPVSATDPPVARNGVCESGEFCLYYYTNYGGSVSDFNRSVSNYGSTQPSCYEFRGPGAGQGDCVKNNAESVWNRSSHAVAVYYNSYCKGPSQTFASGQYSNLNSTLADNNASHCIR